MGHDTQAIHLLTTSHRPHFLLKMYRWPVPQRPPQTNETETMASFNLESKPTCENDMIPLAPENN